MQINSRWRALAAAAALAALCAAPGTFAFDVTDIQGHRHRLADYKGRWVVLNFWATWCVPCIQEIPEIAQFHRAHEDVVVIGVAIDAEDADKVKRFAAKVGHDYPLVIANERVEKQLGAMRALPTTRIYDPKGKVAYDKPGRVDRKFLEEKVVSGTAFHGADATAGKVVPDAVFLARPVSGG